MKRHPALLTLLLAPLLVSAAGCVGTDVGNPQDTQTQFVFTTELPEEMVANGLISRGAELTEAWVTIDSIELREDCSSSRAESIPGPFFVDLLATDKSTIPAVIGRSDYCRLIVTLAPGEEAPTALQDRAIWLKGKRADGADFEVSAEAPISMRFRGPKGLIQIEDRSQILGNLAVFDWIAAGGLDDEPEGQLRFTDIGAPSVFNAFERDLKAKSKFYPDLDQDGQISPDETEPLAEGE